MKTIYIVGGNGFARECYNSITILTKYNPEIKFGGFLGHGGYGHTVDYKDCQHLYLGEVADRQFSENEYVVIGAGYPELRLKIYSELKERKIKFFNLILPSVSIPKNTNLGEANIIVGNSLLSVNCNIGVGNVFNSDVIVGHDSEIGDFNFFGPRSQALGNVKIGSMNQIGANAILLPHSKIGDNNKIAPLSAVYKGCKNNCYMSGNPAIKIGSTDND